MKRSENVLLGCIGTFAEFLVAHSALVGPKKQMNGTDML